MSPDDPTVQASAPNGAADSSSTKFPTAALNAPPVSRDLATSDSLIRLIEGQPPASAPTRRAMLEGTLVGDVRVRQVIGEGGMGRVYEGLQEQLGRTVALKIIRPGLTTPEMRTRLTDEATILARLRHQGIAQIFGAGVHIVSGVAVPYFVMELIPNARPLTRYADDFALSVRDRLKLFHSVCDAVAHGHQKGVIHRDLKPSNILVDSEGTPTVIDFGVARTITTDLTTMTMDGRWPPGTPSHMSPEQFAGRESEIDERTDVYSLGVVLYQLLARRPPFEFDNQPLPLIARTVREEEPPPLRSFVPNIPRDLDAIAAHCVHKDKSRRYANAGELRDDIGRYLVGEPILARPPSAWESLQRFALRHRAVSFAAAGVLAAFIVAFLGIVVFALEAWAQQRRTERVLSLAIRLLPDMPSQDAGLAWVMADDGRVSPLELLRHHRSEVERELDDMARATLLHAIGESLMRLGEYGEAADAARDAYALWRSLCGPYSSETLTSLSLLTTSLLCMDDAQDAVANAEALVAGCTQRYDPGHPRAIDAMLMLARAQRRVGNVSEAERVARDALQKSHARNGRDNRLTLLALNNLGVAYCQRGAWDKAISCYEEAYRTSRARYSASDRDALQFGHNLGVAYLRAADRKTRGARSTDANDLHDRGIRILEEVCRFRQFALGFDHPDSTTSLAELAKALIARREADSVMALLSPCSEVLEKRARSGDRNAAAALGLLRLARHMQAEKTAGSATLPPRAGERQEPHP